MKHPHDQQGHGMPCRLIGSMDTSTGEISVLPDFCLLCCCAIDKRTITGLAG